MTFLAALVALLQAITEYLRYKTKRLPLDLLYKSLEIEEGLQKRIDVLKSPSEISVLLKRLKIQQEISKSLEEDLANNDINM